MSRLAVPGRDQAEHLDSRAVRPSGAGRGSCSVMPAGAARARSAPAGRARRCPRPAAARRGVRQRPGRAAAGCAAASRSPPLSAASAAREQGHGQRIGLATGSQACRRLVPARPGLACQVRLIFGPHPPSWWPISAANVRLVQRAGPARPGAELGPPRRAPAEQLRGPGAEAWLCAGAAADAGTRPPAAATRSGGWRRDVGAGRGVRHQGQGAAGCSCGQPQLGFQAAGAVSARLETGCGECGPDRGPRIRARRNQIAAGQAPCRREQRPAVRTGSAGAGGAGRAPLDDLGRLVPPAQ